MNTFVKYVVTDPCYLLSDETWDECCKVFDKYKNDEFMYQRFDEAVSKALSEFIGYPAYACGTGFGDWSNEIWGSGVIKGDFFADAGMVCVCRLTDKILAQLQAKYGKSDDFSGMAIFEMSENINVSFDVSNKDWTVVEIRDLQTGNIIQSQSYDDSFDDEDDYFDEEEEY